MCASPRDSVPVCLLRGTFVVVVFVCGLWMSSAPAFAELESPDRKVWLAQNFSFRLDATRTLFFDFNERFFDDASRWEEIYANLGMAFTLNDRLTIAPVWRFIRARFQSAQELTENRVHLNLEYKIQRGRHTWAFRSRCEYRTFENKAIKHRFTERIKFTLPTRWKTRSGPIRAYISDEVYHDLDLNETNNHEWQFGLIFPTRQGEIQAFLGHEVKKKAGRWNYHTNILGLEVGYRY